jgi:hypothetical protein
MKKQASRGGLFDDQPVIISGDDRDDGSTVVVMPPQRPKGAQPRTERSSQMKPAEDVTQALVRGVTLILTCGNIYNLKPQIARYLDDDVIRAAIDKLEAARRS